MRNAEQILTIMTATFGEELFDTTASDEFCLRKETDAEDLACRWRLLVKSSRTMSKSDLDPEWTLAMSQVRHNHGRNTNTFADLAGLLVAQRCSEAIE